jgi:redox-sensitive bicupin YhaK (pirin superfamily)
MYLDFKLNPNSSFNQPIPMDWNAFVFILKGEGVFGTDQTKAGAHHTLILNKGNSLHFKNESKDVLHFVLLGGKPLHQSIVQHGPFVMNSQEEINQAIMDYQLCRNGFEKAKDWSSEGIMRSLVFRK